VICIPCGKTGTLKPPTKPDNMLDFVEKNAKAEKMCSTSRTDTLLYHDERGGLSLRAVRDYTTMKLGPNVLGVYHFAGGKVIEKTGIIQRLVKMQLKVEGISR
jgi:hypothetical protein